jgi:Cd2+/Zn2+-exporting ATPase
MQRFILSKRNHIAAIQAVLITIGFTSKLAFAQEYMAVWALAIASVLGFFPIAIQAYQALKIKVISIDVLVTIAVLGAFFLRNFEESAIVTFLFLFGAYLEQRTLHKTRSAIRELTEMAPDRALKRMDDGSYNEVDIDLVSVGDLLLVKTGAKVPVDGKVVHGSGYVNEASITGEATPVSKREASQVFAGTMVENGTLTMIAERVGEDTTFGKIIELVEEAQDAKSEAERFIDSFSKYYTPAVLVFAALVWVISQDIELAITILVLGCPGALVIGVPVSHVAGIGNGARHGILLKGSEVIHDFSKVDTMIFDKTGTLTIGKPMVSDVQVYTKNQEVLGYLASVERESDHPLAKAIVTYLEKQQIHTVEHTDVVPGGGVVATVAHHRVVIGNLALMEQEQVSISDQVQKDIDRYEVQGDSLVLTAVDGELAVLMGIRDQIRPRVKQDVQRLKRLGVKHLMLLSGDHQGTVDHVAHQLGLTEAYGHMLPQDKAEYIKQLQKQNRIVAFVGDGVNDSPSIALAQVGIAMGSGTDVAIETSDVVLMQSDFSRLPHALGLAQATAKNMRQNIGIAIGVVLILLFSVFFSDWMSMSIGMLVHEASILIVILNGMRLLRYRLRKI